MTKEEVQEKVIPYLSSALSGGEVENPKIDFKRQWYNLKDKEEVAEFLMDTSAIANTIGLDGFIIIGLDLKEKKLYNAKFSDSGLRDESELLNIISKSVDLIFTINYYEFLFNDFLLSVLHIPPSHSMPHVIRNLVTGKSESKQVILTKKGTSKHRATKFDLENMYYYRGQIIPEYLINSSFHISTLKMDVFRAPDVNTEHIAKDRLTINLENLGRRPVSINSIFIDLYCVKDPIPENIVSLSFQFATEPLILQSGQIASRNLKSDHYYSNHDPYLKTLKFSRNNVLQNRANLLTNYISLELSDGSIHKSELIISGL